MDLISKDISSEEYREYEWTDPVTKERVKYQVKDPITLYTRENGTTHRVVDKDGITHCIPSVGQLGCALRWKTKSGSPPVSF